MAQTSSTKSCLLRTAPPSSFSSSSLYLSSSTLPNSPPTHHHLSIFLFSLPSHTSLSLCEEWWGGVRGGRPSPAGLFVPTCTCWKSGGMTQTGYPTLSTTIYTQTHPEPNTILPGSVSGGGALRGGRWQWKQRQREKNSQTDRCKDETARWCLKYEQYVNSLLLIIYRQMERFSTYIDIHSAYGYTSFQRMCNHFILISSTK